MISVDPFNVWLFDVNAFIKQTGILPVRSLSIYQPSSSIYAEDGLFSEKIFGELGSTNRMVTLAYITLNTPILQPIIYKNVVKLASLYEEIINGSAYAIFDTNEKNFVRCVKHEEHPDAGTGYTFFMSRFHEINFERNASRQRSDRIDIIEKYRNVLFCNNFLVLPAGLRDLDEQQMVLDDINKLYQTLLSYTFSIPFNANSTMYDGVRCAIQKKAVEIYDYIEGILRYKRGFIQGVWGHRRIALGTRNVITAATYATMTPNDPQTIQPDETKLGLFQTAKALQPLTIHHIRRNFFDPIFGSGSNLVALTDPTTYELAYRTIGSEELARFNTPESIEDWISRFQNVDTRNKPVIVHDDKGRPYYLLMVYDEGNTISLFRSITEFEKVAAKKPLAVIVKGNPKYISDPKIEPMANKFYAEVAQLLENKGYRVAFDPGLEYTSPDTSAQVWIGHSRGIDRLRFAPEHIKTIELLTQDHTMKFVNNDERGSAPEHYQLSKEDRAAINALQPSSTIDKKKIRPLTWVELLYMATSNAASDKHVFITRYPVIQDESCYPTKIHLCSTVPSRIVNLKNTIADQVVHTYPEYPILGNPYLDSIQLGTARLKGLDGDYDGDTTSANAILSDEANNELNTFLGSVLSVVNAQKELLIGARDDLIAYTMLALSRA